MSEQDAGNRTTKRRRLGRGLSGMIGEPANVEQTAQAELSKPPSRREIQQVSETINNTNTHSLGDQAADGERLTRIGLSGIIPNRSQPRKSFDEDQLRALAASIQSEGLMQPIVVRPASSGGSTGGRYELIAGERRWRAAKIAGLETIPAIVREASDKSAAQLALIENVHREDLNAIERAEALSELSSRFHMQQAEIAELVGMDRSSVSNLIRLTELEEEIRELIARDELGQGHGKALLSVAPGEGRVKLAIKAAREEWSVREMERQAKAAGREVTPGATPSPRRSAVHADLEKRLADRLGTKVAIKTNPSGTKGKLVIEFYGVDHFEGLMSALGVEGERV